MLRFMVKIETANNCRLRFKNNVKSRDRFVFDVSKIGFKAATLRRNRHRSVFFLISSYCKCFNEFFAFTKTQFFKENAFFTDPQGLRIIFLWKK